jgi:shikimate kinase
VNAAVGRDRAITPSADRVLLIGMMGSGKSTVGRALATRLGWPFLDNDALVRERSGRDPAEIDASDGEEALHDVEAAAFRAAIERPGPDVIAVAGSVVDRPAERERMRGAGHVVWLRAGPATLRRRIGDGRGRRDEALDLDWITARAAEREPVYRAVAAQVVDVDAASVDEIVAAILAATGDAAGPSTG